ncbi:LCP family protein [Microbacterium sp. Yaish 1]|uniref:LCP family protein n=1 Tax=Microbacterium sp. Yaish 1 TaxID=2025014 RepID=UPI000B9430B2|nr:LCP family protein [Microbacterium sp. Yaish 1]OYC97493.1 transcriptional regulator [Microbacterium sp. Yaish 1]
MSVSAPPRSSARPRRSNLIEERPLRHPDTSSPEVMGRRGWWLVVLTFLLPGSAQVLAGNRRLGRFGLAATITMWALALLTVLTGLLWRPLLLSLATNWFVLLIVQALIAFYAVLWLVLTVDTLRLVRLVRAGTVARIGVPLLAIVLAVASTSAAAWTFDRVNSVRETLSTVFGSSGPSVPPSDGYYNILLLGADSGEGRDSMRFDSISVVSVNAETGATTITGVPRDMGHFPFAPGPMKDLYPDIHEGRVDPNCGWSSGINQLQTEVEICRDGNALYPDAKNNGSSPGVEATKDAVEGILGITIPYYVFIDMKGFADLVDALGGVDINVVERLPKGGGPRYEGQSAEDWAEGWIEAGQQHMDGDTAQWYARSRYTTSDFDRMRRQRELQQAILAQMTPQNVLDRFTEIADAGQVLVQTDIPADLLPFLADIAIKAKEQPVTTIELTPANGIEEADPDWALVRQMVQDALHPQTPTPEPEG